MSKKRLKWQKKKIRPDRAFTPYERLKRYRYKKKYGHRIKELENALLQDLTVSIPTVEQIEIMRKLYPLFMLSPFCNQLAFKYDSSFEQNGIILPSLFKMMQKGKKPNKDSLAAHKLQVKSGDYKDKRCYKCKRFKNPNEFYNNKSRYDGKQNICKDCS